MSERQRRAIDWVLKHEGGFSDDPHDPGGATNYGISLRWLRSLDDSLKFYDFDRDGDLDADDMRALTRDQARELYLQRWWHSIYDDLNMAAGVEVFDCAINMGQQAAFKLLQRSINELLIERGGARGATPMLMVDGIVGPKTRNAALRTAPDALRNKFEAKQAQMYFHLVLRDAVRLKYLMGWLRRAYDRPDQFAL